MVREQLRNRKGTMDVGELRDWCEQNSLPTDAADIADLDEHRVFVGAYEVSSERVYVMFSTKRLATICSNSSVLQTDATHKVNWHGYPFVVVGHQDLDRHVHGTSLHVVWKEEDTDVYNTVSL